MKTSTQNIWRRASDSQKTTIPREHISARMASTTTSHDAIWNNIKEQVRKAEKLSNG